MKVELIPSHCTIAGVEVTPKALAVTSNYTRLSAFTGKAPDPEWSYVDNQGHLHSYDESMGLPTLRQEFETEWLYCCELCGGDTETTTFYTCLKCEERIEPGLKIETFPSRNLITSRSAELTALCPYSLITNSAQIHHVEVILADSARLRCDMVLSEASFREGGKVLVTLLGSLDVTPDSDS